MSIILKNRGNYKELLTFKKATLIYDLTYYFATHYLGKGDRTVDQMIQAARSGKQNIAEGVAASSTNAETEIKLINVAKASLKELLTDFEDYLRTRQIPQWEFNSKELNWVREKAVNELSSDYWLNIARSRDAGVLANIAIVLLKQEDYLLFRQLEALEVQFRQNGDLRGRMHEASGEIRANCYERENREAMTLGYPKCPKCGRVMSNSEVRRPGEAFIIDYQWSCSLCATEQFMTREEFNEVEKRRRRRLEEVRRKYNDLLRK